MNFFLTFIHSGSDYRVVINFPPTEKYEPIGLTIACNGHLYVGVYSLLLSGTSLVLEIDPKYDVIISFKYVNVQN